MIGFVEEIVDKATVGFEEAQYNCYGFSKLDVWLITLAYIFLSKTPSTSKV